MSRVADLRMLLNIAAAPLAPMRDRRIDFGIAAVDVSRKLRMSGGLLNRKLSSAKSAEGEDDTGGGERELRAQSSELQVAC